MSFLMIAAAVVSTATEPPKTQVYALPKGVTAADLGAFASCYRMRPAPVAGQREAVQRLGELPKANEYKLVMRSGPDCMRPSDVRYEVEDQIRRVTPAGGQPNRR